MKFLIPLSFALVFASPFPADSPARPGRANADADLNPPTRGRANADADIIPITDASNGRPPTHQRQPANGDLSAIAEQAQRPATHQRQPANGDLSSVAQQAQRPANHERHPALGQDDFAHILQSSEDGHTGSNGFNLNGGSSQDAGFNLNTPETHEFSAASQSDLQESIAHENAMTGHSVGADGKVTAHEPSVIPHPEG